MDIKPVSIPSEALSDFICRALVRVGLPPADAQKVSTLMAQADLQGSDGHGAIRLPQYVKRIQAGGINTAPNIRVVAERAGMALLDGDNGMGHLVVSRAVELAIEKARQAGIAWVGMRASNHAGPASLYVRMPLVHDMIGMYFAVGNANHLPPWGGIEMLLSTNPIAVSIPAGEEPAIGGHKGYGLALIVGLLAGTLNGAAMGREVIDFNFDHVTPTNTGQAILVINVEAFADVSAFKTKVDRLSRDIRGSQRLPGIQRIWLPGEQSRKRRQEFSEAGIPINVALINELDQLAAQLGVESIASSLSRGGARRPAKTVL